MTSERDRDEDREWRNAFEALPRDMEPPAALEDRLVNSLYQRRLLKKANRPRWLLPRLLPLAAVLVLGFSIGRWWGGTSPNESQPRFLLVLHESQQFRAALSVPAAQLVEEYAAWAGDLAARGLLIRGEKLKDQGAWLSQTSNGLGLRSFTLDQEPSFIGGFFLIRAESYESALSIAETCPHLSYGGTIEVRVIDPT